MTDRKINCIKHGIVFIDSIWIGGFPICWEESFYESFDFKGDR